MTRYLVSSLCYFCVLFFFVFSVSGLPMLDETEIQSLIRPYKLYSRWEWGAAPPLAPRPLDTPVPYVVIHHTYIPEACNTTNQCKKAMKAMQNYHRNQGWGDIGYHFCVGSEGDAYQGRGWSVQGGHATKANNYSIGICLIGDWRTVRPPQAMLQTTQSLIYIGVKLGVISESYKLIGHNQVQPTECPGSALTHEISTWKHYDPAPFAIEKTSDFKSEKIN